MKRISPGAALLAILMLSPIAKGQAPDDLVLFSLLRPNLSFDGGKSGTGWASLQKAVDLMETGTMQAAKAQTECRSSYDEMAVYFFLEMKDIPGAQRDAVEVWIEPAESKGPIYQFLIERDRAELKTYLRRNGEARAVENAGEAKIHRTSGAWTAQLRIPFIALQSKVPADNTRWGFNFNRHWQTAQAEELSSWSPVNRFDQPRDFGKLAFYSKGEIQADIAYWENNDNDPLLRRSTVPGHAITSKSGWKSAPSSLWTYDPFTVDRAAVEKWQCFGLTTQLSATNRGRAASAEKNYPDFYRAADAINLLLLQLSETRQVINQLERAVYYSSPEKDPPAGPAPVLNEKYASVEETLDEAFAQYGAAFLAGWDAGKLQGLDDTLASLGSEITALQGETASALKALQETAQKHSPWSPVNLRLEDSDERRNTNGAPLRFWFTAYSLQGTEPAARYFGPFRSWNIDWPSLLATRDLDGKFALPFATKALDRLAAKDMKLNFHTGIGLVSYQIPTSKWLEQRIGADPEILAQSQDHIAIPKTQVGSLDAFMRRGANIESPVTTQYAGDYLEFLIRQMNEGGRVDFVVNGWEDRTELRIREKGGVLTRQRGYDALSKAAFQEFLKARYGTIEELRKKWNVQGYQSFSDILPPEDPFLSRVPKAGGLSYEWQRWQEHSHFAWGEKLRAAVKKAAPDVPVMTDSSHLLLQGAGRTAMDGKSADIVSFHYTPANQDAMYAYLQSLSRRSGVPLACFENYILMYSRLEGDDERIGARAMHRYFFDLIARDIRNLSFWLGYQATATSYIAAYGGGTFRLDHDQTILRWPAAEIALGKKEIGRLERSLVESAAEPGRLAVIVPDSSFRQTQYLQGERQKGSSMDPIVKFQNIVLSERSLPAEYLHEDELADSKEDLAAYDAIVVIDAPYMQKEALAKLAAWTAQPGKELFVAGPLGFFDECAQPLPEGNSPLRAAFPQSSLQAARPWLLKAEKDADWMESAPFGGGKVTRLTRTFEEFEADPAQLKNLGTSIESAVERTAEVTAEQIRFQVRRGASGETYLLVSNRDLREPHSFSMTVKGNYARVLDIAIPDWFPAPSSTQDGATTFQGYLAPADWTIFQLEAQPPVPGTEP